MTNPENQNNPKMVYLDQNILSKLREDDPASDDLRGILNQLSTHGAMFVYSMIHVDECRASGRPDAFVRALDALSAWFIEPCAAGDHRVTLSHGRADELILASSDITHEASRRMEDLLKPMHFAMGWLDGLDATSLREEMVQGIDEFWGVLEGGLPSEMHDWLIEGKRSILEAINGMPLEQVRNERNDWFERVRSRLPENYAQLDAVPADQVVHWVFNRLDHADQEQFEKLFPRRFWAEVDGREEGGLTGFAFLLFTLGIVRDRRVSSKGRSRREKHFLGQFRDCQHIEEASRCAAFITFDKGAWRLAKAAYAYAGVETEVIYLEVRDS
jgi:hypothetical protein